MDYALEERIGNPDLFTGRKEELDYFLKWISDIKERKSQSTAMLARRKMGKTALLERLFNITFYKNDGVIPFYYEIKEVKMWVGDFCVQFFLSFIYQYIAFKTRKYEYLKPEEKSDFAKVIDIAKREGMDYLIGIIESAAHAAAHEKVDILWDIAREAPQTIAFRQKEFIVQMIDEFQFMNAMIYWDKGKSDGQLADTLADHGVIKSTWMEYVKTAFSKVNDRNAKKIVLHLCKHKCRELTRKELMEDLNLDMPDEKLEEKMEALVKADIINQGQTNFDYRCVQDNIFDKVFRGVYQKEIEHFEVGEIKKEYIEELDKIKQQYNSLLGMHNCTPEGFICRIFAAGTIKAARP